ncbi:hypothetical protein [Cryptosporangium sp. NPDC051539]|uniref:hypothetical protein n=1 Tax=Cryptosporangium sp. NPDC051539 TaxID=3363962 RepID=UPI0037AF0CF8
MRRTLLRAVFALCAAVMAAAGLGASASPVSASTGFAGTAPAIALAPHSAGAAGAPSRARPATTRPASAAESTASPSAPVRSGENSAPASVTALRVHTDGLPAGTAATLLALAPLLIPLGRALTGAPTRAPPAPAGLPETRAPPSSGRF